MTKKIKFHEPTWVLYRQVFSEGFTGTNQTVTAKLVKPEIFNVLSITRSKKTQASDIHVWSSNNGANSDHIYLINVPNGVYKEINEEKHNENTN
jgi:hypothetical protein